MHIDSAYEAYFEPQFFSLLKTVNRFIDCDNLIVF